MAIVSAVSVSVRSKRMGFDLASWLVLALASAILALGLAQAMAYLRLPTDGWSFVRDVSGAGQRLIFAENLVGLASPLRPGDELVAVGDVSIEQLRERALTVSTNQLPQWLSGANVAYTVVRGGQRLTFDVPLAYMPKAVLVRHLAWYYLTDPSLLPAVLIGLFVFLYRPRSPAARLLFVVCSCFFASTGLSQAVHDSNVLGPAELRDWRSFWPAVFFNSLIWPLMIAPAFIHLFLSFPSVKWPVRAHQRLALAICYGLTPVLTILALTLHWGRPLDFWQAWNTITVGVYFATLLAVVASMIHTLATGHDPDSRAQVRWVAWGALVTSAGAIAGGVIGSLGLLGSYPLLDFAAFRLPMLAFPVALALAITRYHLFDIDIVINRTLVYSALTAALALVYVGTVVLLEGLLRVIAWQGSSSLVTVFSTLTIALLFNPFRQQIQMLIDQRFFRRKYDAARTLAQFSATACDEVDLGRLAEHLIQVVDGAMQPEFVSLYLYDASPCERPPAPRDRSC
ncbi:MAG TPA: hypothetical protein VFX76_22560 [Roseiflexaceae bacterium]|nr:hypothetical protein [Roseiflexaceae bacterium]